jgi:glycosyltransferase involved in cell wall biosynthesis
MNPPAISIVMPVYNGREYLRLAIGSVLDQEFQDYELIIWNDCSTDESLDIINEYDDPRIKAFSSHRNGGLFKTINLGIQASSAALIRLWCQDDVMKPNCLATEVAFHSRFPEVGLGFSLYDVIDQSGLVTPATPSKHPSVLSRELANQLMFYHGSIPGNISNVVLKRSALEDVGLFREDLVIAGDFEMWVRIAEHYPLGYINEPLIFVRGHAGQLSNQTDSYVICMREEEPLYEILANRLPTSLQSYARSYDLLHRYPMYLHHSVKRLLSADVANARAAYEMFSHSGHRLFVGLFWLLTANQRLYRLKPKYAGCRASE